MAAVEFEDTEGRAWFFVYGADLQPEGHWKVNSGAGGSKAGEPRGAEPWANFGGWGWPRFIALGGRVHGAGVAHVRLVDANGRSVEDDVSEGIALLLLNERVTMPCLIELRDAAGDVVATQTWPRHGGDTGRAGVSR